MSLNPFDDFRVLFDSLPEKDDFAASLVKKRLLELSYPKGSLCGIGDLKKILTWYAAWRGSENIRIDKPTIAVYAGSQGILGNSEQVKKVVLNLQTAGSMLNGFCAEYGVTLRVYDLALDYPTMDISVDAAMDERGCAATMAFGLESIADNVDLLGVASVRYGTVPYSEACLAMKILGGQITDWLPESCSHEDIERANVILSYHECDADADSFNLLRRFGSRELAAITGAILSTRMERVPIVLEGYSSLIAAALLKRVSPKAIEHCIIAQVPQSDQRYQRLIEYLDIPVMFDFCVDDNLGVNLPLALSLIKGAIRSFLNAKTFDQSEADIRNN